MRRPLASLIALLPLLLLLAAPCATARAQDGAAPAAGFSLRGTVVNAATGQPIARALVSLADAQAVLTDPNGQFSFLSINPGIYQLSVTKPGYQSRGNALRGITGRVGRAALAHHEPPLQVQTGPDTPAVTIPLTPLASIVGRVTLSTADPPDGIRIQILARQLQSGHPHWTTIGQVRVRNDGSFHIADLDPGSYRLATVPSLDRPGLGLNTREAVWGYPSLYYPGTTDVSGAGVLTLGPGQQAEADITLTRQQFFPVTAVLQSSTDTPASFEILDSGGRQTGLFANWDRRDGLVHALAPNGTWTLEAHVYGRTMEYGSTTFQVNGAPATLAIGIQPIPRIPVIIHRDFVASADGSQPPVPGPGMNLELTSADDIDTSAGSMMHADDNPSGSNWELNINRPGRYWIKVEPYQPAYVSSITSGGVDLGSAPLTILPGSTPQPVEVTLRNDGGTLSGDVKSLATPASPQSVTNPQVWIYAIPLFSTAAAMRNLMPNSDGRFTFYNMAPGPYRVVACDAPQDIDFHSPEGLAAWSGKGQTVTLDPAGTASVDLDIVHATTGAAQ